MIRIGILGAARVAEYALIAPAAERSDVAIAAVASRDADKARSYADKHGIADALAYYEAMLARPDIDLVYNALPPSRHADLSIAALEAGKHVLCEKPFAMNADEARAMVKAAESSGRHLIEAFHYRFHPAFDRFLAILESDAIGDLVSVDGIFTVPIPASPGELRHDPMLGGGALMDLGCYPAHWLRTVVGEEPDVATVDAVLSETGVDLSLTADLEFPASVTGSLACSMAMDCSFAARLSVEGTAGRIDFTNPLAPHMGHDIRIEAGGRERIERVDGQSTYWHQLDHVVAVVSGSTDPRTGGTDAVSNMALIDALYDAAGVAR
ncbi:Gfo/Idh/MocA family oxidoreductase [Parasphingopyxis algicola]|uniref:Gfo/Idh/MocA family protein n=1 Tax=Parasphingopyxis algicola TaxID=2026624 RepID=UPI0015A42122|nr:Gfo/Idh/MocA family oxidoreductase [Parasphingopyxis algicola]QLC24742.1 Gfo/Idh/MocA family oxidoreductase [Parasphingopyxis algicola]